MKRIKKTIEYRCSAGLGQHFVIGSKGQPYEVTIPYSSTAMPTCTCKGWSYVKQHTDGKCRHVKEALAEVCGWSSDIPYGNMVCPECGAPVIQTEREEI